MSIQPLQLTTANSTMVMAVPGLYAAAPIYGYSVDDAFSTAEVKPSEVLMGVDGSLSGGYTPYPVPLDIVLQADSASNSAFDVWLNTMDATNTALQASITLYVPSLLQVYTFTNGYLTSASRMPAGKKLLQPRRFQITFERMTVAPI